MNLSRFPRRRYTEGRTPIEKLDHLTKHFNGPNIYIKRDDLLGLSAGGNKTRKLEFVVADALEHGADTLITCGAVQSNHCRLTLAAAIREGLKCRLVLEERVAGSYNPQSSGNNFLYRLLGVEDIKVVPGGSDMAGEMAAMDAKLKSEGRNGYIIPGGASNAIGATGYVACAQEILNQTYETGLRIDHIVTASGSGGTHAGLLAGFYGSNCDIPVTGIGVRKRKAEQENLIFELANQTAERIGLQQAIPRELVICFDEYVGPGYSIPTAGMIEAVKMLARIEGILLDPVYPGKAMAGFIDLIRKNHFNKNENVLFIHTGGSPALYAYDSEIMENEKLFEKENPN